MQRKDCFHFKRDNCILVLGDCMDRYSDSLTIVSSNGFSSQLLPQRCVAFARDSLRKNLASEFFDPKASHFRKEFCEKKLPFISCAREKESSKITTFFALIPFSSEAFKFFYEVIKRWLLPQRQLSVVFAYTADIRLSDLDDKVYTICEIAVDLRSFEEWREIEKNFTSLQAEIALGMKSASYARHFLDFKEPFTDTKTASVQEIIASFAERFPTVFDSSIFKDMQHFLVMREDSFKTCRTARHLCRLICIQFLLRNSLQELIQKNEKKRHLFVRVFRSKIIHESKTKKTLSIMVGLNCLDNDENFCEKKMLKAIQQYIPSAQKIENTFFVQEFHSPRICLAYIEVEKEDGSLFTSSEIRRLRRELPHNLKSRVEHRLHTLFMPRNDEEVMRGILTLSQQLKYVRDIPQVSIVFDEQADTHLYFTVILVRLMKSSSMSISDLFKKNKGYSEYLHDCIRVMGFVRKKYPKEATVFRLKLPKEDFLRTDHSIDLHKARQKVVQELINAVGEIRDYNGGMISLQHELLKSIRETLSDVKEMDDLLLDNFFYSLSPVSVRSLVDPYAFKRLYLMLLEGLGEYKSGEYYLKFYSEPYNVYALIVVENPRIKDWIQSAIQDLHIPSLEIAFASVNVHGLTCVGCICCAQDPAKKEQLFSMISDILKSHY